MDLSPCEVDLQSRSDARTKTCFLVNFCSRRHPRYLSTRVDKVIPIQIDGFTERTGPEESIGDVSDGVHVAQCREAGL